MIPSEFIRTLSIEKIERIYYRLWILKSSQQLSCSRILYELIFYNQMVRYPIL